MTLGLAAAGIILLLIGAVVLKLFFWTISKTIKMAFYGLVLLSVVGAGVAVWWVYFAR